MRTLSRSLSVAAIMIAAFIFSANVHAVTTTGMTTRLSTRVVVPQNLFGTTISAAKLRSVESSFLKHSGVLENRPVILNTKALIKEKLSGGRIRLNTRIPLNLGAGKEYTAVLEKSLETVGKHAVWRGTLENVPKSRVNLVMKNNILIGNIYTPKEITEIRYAGQGVHVTRRIDPSKFPEDLHRVPVRAPTATLHRPETRTEVSAIALPTTIDLMVAYTREAVVAEGGTTAMQNLIELAVDEANEAYENSGVMITLRLVKTYQTNYTESGSFDTELDRLEDVDDGFMDNLHAMRDQYGADIVTLFIKQAEERSCGIGYLMTEDNESSFASKAFNVIDKDCVSNRSLPHELGHNMGAHHDKANADTPGRYSYSYGYQDPDDEFRTIMAYKCPDDETCPRIAFFSNSGRLYNGKSMGSSEYNNAMTLNNTRDVVAAFRPWKIDLGRFIPIIINRAY